MECSDSEICMGRSSDILGLEWRRLGFVVRIVLGFLVCLVFFRPVMGLRPLRERARSWGDEVRMNYSLRA